MKDEERKIFERTVALYPRFEPPTNVFVIECDRIMHPDDIYRERMTIEGGIKAGVVILPPWYKLVAVTGPCTDVEVKIISPEEVR